MLLSLMVFFLLSGFRLSSTIEFWYYVIRILNFLCIILLVMSLEAKTIKKLFISLSSMSIILIAAIPIFDLNIIVDSFSYMAIPFFVLQKPKIFVFTIAVVMIFILLKLDVRGSMLAIILIMLHRLCGNIFLFYKNNWNKLLIPIIALLVYGEFYIAINYFDDIGLNVVLNKRPYIWHIYLIEFFEGDLVHQLFGYGRITGDIALSVGEMVSNQFGVGRKYSAHSLYIGSLYEMGLVGISLIMFFSFQIIYVNNSKELDDYQFLFLIFLLLGLVSPIYLAGHSASDFVFTLLFMFLLKSKREAQYV